MIPISDYTPIKTNRQQVQNNWSSIIGRITQDKSSTHKASFEQFASNRIDRQKRHIHIRLLGNEIGDIVAPTLSKGLKRNMSLAKLDLSGSNK